MLPPHPACPCLSGAWNTVAFVEHELGVDPTAGRFAEVRLDHCLRCGRWWLHYYVVYEAFSGSGRWFRGTIPPSMIGHVTATNAPLLFAALPWYWSGGSYYNGNISRTSGPLPL